MTVPLSINEKPERLCPRCHTDQVFGTPDGHFECTRCSYTWMEHPFDAALVSIMHINAQQEPTLLVQTAQLAAANHDLIETARRTIALNEQLLQDRATLREDIRRIKLGVLSIIQAELSATEQQYANPDVRERSYFMGKRAAIMKIIAEISQLFWPG